VGLEKADDAGVYRLTDDLAIVQTVDFFTPVVDDPYTFGQIAAANALSDVYAMGGRPLTAMNIVCFPRDTLDISVLREILRGGLDKLREAGVVLVGGHSVDDVELKYGLSVTGTVHPKRVLTKGGARPGDALILTKPVGTGIINTAVKGGMAGQGAAAAVARSMAALNKAAAEVMLEVGVNACTDITGFGLLGHACEMILEGQVGLRIHSAAVPLFPETVEMARMGLVPGGTYRNKEYRAKMVDSTGIGEVVLDILFDPQTSGGLFMAVDAGKSGLMLARLKEAGVSDAAIVGEAVSRPAQRIVVD
jgi:selenide, water dikinase